MKSVLFLVLLVVSSLWPMHGADLTKEDSENDVKEAVFRYQFAHLTPEQQQVSAKFYVLSYGDKAAQPDKQFLKRFATNSPPVTEGYLVFGTSQGWFLKGKQDRGLAFKVTRVNWISDTEAKAIGNCQETAAFNSWHKYHVKKQNGAWVIQDSQ